MFLPTGSLYDSTASGGCHFHHFYAFLSSLHFALLNASLALRRLLVSNPPATTTTTTTTASAAAAGSNRMWTSSFLDAFAAFGRRRRKRGKETEI